MADSPEVGKHEKWLRIASVYERLPQPLHGTHHAPHPALTHEMSKKVTKPSEGARPPIEHGMTIMADDASCIFCCFPHVL
jgi:hypothetical protein